MELKNKNVFVTGSTRGIGLAVAHKFASLGTQRYPKWTFYRNL